MGSSASLLWPMFWILPAIAGLVLGLAKPPEAVSWVNNASAWWSRRYLAAKAKGGLFVGGLWRWLIWGFHKLHGWTEAIEDAAIRAGVRAALFFYVGGLSLFVIASAIYLAVVLALIVFGFWVLGKFLNSENEGSAAPSPRYRRPAKAHVAGATSSRAKKDFWGNDYTEHRGRDGEVVATSADRKDMWGNEYVETRGRDGEVLQTSASREGFFGGQYTETRNAEGNVAHTSADRKGLLGEEYTEHLNADGDEIARSRDRTGWLGDDYVEHDKKE